MPTLEQAKHYYDPHDPVHGFPHILRVIRLCDQIGRKEKADLEILQAAALLHDLEGDVNSRLEHHLAAADRAAGLLRDEGWTEERISAVSHCIRSHRFRDQQEQPRTIEAQVLFDADKLDAIGAVGIARAIAYAVRADQPLYPLPSETFRTSYTREDGEPHTPYHEFLFKLSRIPDRLYTSTGRSLAVERDQIMRDFFNQWEIELGGLC